MASKFSQFRGVKNGKDGFKQPPASALLSKLFNANTDSNSTVLGKFKLGYSFLERSGD